MIHLLVGGNQGSRHAATRESDFQDDALALSSQWSRFSDAWHHCLQKDPAIEYFKMSEAHSMKGQFASFNPRLRDQKVLDLAEIAEQHSVARMCTVVSREDFDNYVKVYTPWREIQNPYFMLFYQVMVLTIDFFQGLGESTSMDVEEFEVEFIFDEQGRFGLDALAWWDVFKQALNPEQLKFIGSAPIFKSDRKMLPLQAADLYAWHARHVFEGGDSSIRTGAVIHTLKKVPPIGGMVTGDQTLNGLPELVKIAENYWPK